MCVVSAVLDYGKHTIPIPSSPSIPIPSIWWPNITPPPNPLPPDSFHTTQLPRAPFDFEGYKAYSELLRKAAEYDRIMKEPNCHDPKKLEFLKELMKKMDALGEEFRVISMEIKELFNEENI